MTDKPFKTIDEQIDILINERNLRITNIETAKNALSRYGYYEIINGYKDNFMINPKNDAIGFKDTADFDHIYRLFRMDQNLRNWVMGALEVFEANLRQVVAYVVANNISDRQDVYIDRKKYKSGKKYYNTRIHKYVYPIDDLINVLKKVTHSKKQPCKHYREQHNNIPPWIIVKHLSLGNLIWWTRLLKNEEKNAVITKMLGIPNIFLTEDLKNLFGEFLDLCLNYRNTAAHGGRIYNHYSNDHKLSFKSAQILLNRSSADYRNGKGQSRFGVLLRCLKILSNQEPYNFLKSGTQVIIGNFLKTYPEDREFIFTQMELDDDMLSVDSSHH